MIEVEDKFRVHADFELPTLHGDSGPVSVISRPRSAQLTAAYFDTDDLRLARAGISLRHRVGEGNDGWQLKLPLAGVRLGVREELHEDGPAGQPPQRFVELVTAFVRHAELAQRALLRTERTAYDLLGRDGEPLAELVDDRVDALTADHHAARFREIEIEDRGGGSDVLDHVGKLLRDAGAVAGEFQPKIVRALGSRATAPPDPPAPTAVKETDPARVLVASVLRRHVHALMDLDPWVRLDTDDAVHRMRVSARRLRSALRDFDPLLDPAWSKHTEEELRWLADNLSVSRTIEVLDARLTARLEHLDPALGADRATAVLRRLLDTQADDGSRAAREALSSDRYRDLLDNLTDAAAHPRTRDVANQPVADLLPGLMTASWRRLNKRAKAAASDGTDPALFHRTRIAAKRTRYLAEALEPVYGRPAQRFARQVERLQEILGEHQDAMESGDLLRLAAAEPRVGRGSFALGVLYAEEAAAARAARVRFGSVWPKVRQPRHRRWVRT